MKIVFFIFLALSASLALSATGVTKEGQHIVNTCTAALMQSIPPMWCWKKGGDVGVVPTGCPAGYFRSGAWCFQNCHDTHSFMGGVCYEKCPSDYKNHPLSCYKSIIKWYFKKSYVPKSITNFSNLIPCPDDTYRSGALCYRNCNLIGMENCGIGACASDKDNCVSTIISMVKDVIMGLFDLASFIASFGSSSAIPVAKSTIQKSLPKVGDVGIKAAFKSLKNIMKSKFKSVIKEAAIKAAKNLFMLTKDTLAGLQIDVAETCNYVFDNILNEETKTLPTTQDLIKAIDVFDISNIVDKCKSKNGLDCAKSVLSTVSNFDPTGLLTIATTFMYPTCVVPKSAAIDRDTNYSPDLVKEKCIQVFTEENFEGEMKEICESHDKLFDVVPPFKSMKTSSIASHVFFERENHQGAHFTIGKGGNLKSVKELLSEDSEKTIEELMQSVVLVRDDCLYIYYTVNNNQEVKEICKNHEEINIDLTDASNISLEKYSDSVSVSFFDAPQFKGNKFELKESFQNLDSYQLPIKKIKSIKLKAEYDTLGFLCEHEADTTEFIRVNGKDVECLSFDGVNCFKRPLRGEDCANYIMKNRDKITPLQCGLPYQSKYNTIGYNISNHWCQKGMKYFKVSPEVY